MMAIVSASVVFIILAPSLSGGISEYIKSRRCVCLVCFVSLHCKHELPQCASGWKGLYLVCVFAGLASMVNAL
jgi:hypothetical protein